IPSQCPYTSQCHAHLPPLPSFPTRRSSDLTYTAFAPLNRCATCDPIWLIFTGRSFKNNFPSRATLTTGSSSAVSRTCFTCGTLRSEEHTSELQSRGHLVCRLLLEKKKDKRM